MNEFARPPHWHDTTQVADGLPRLKWTLPEFERLSGLGFFGGIENDEERVELVDGELIPLGPKPPTHERIRCPLTSALFRRLPAGLSLIPALGWRPGGDCYFEPDIIVVSRTAEPIYVPPAEVLLVIEVSDTSLEFDTGLKARIYATLGVPEYWVVDATTLETTVHLGPRAEGYADVATHAPSATVTPTLVPALALSMGGLGIG